MHLIVEGHVVMGLYILGHHSQIIGLVAIFQRSGETISQYFNNFLKVVCDLGKEYVKLPPNTTPEKISSSSRHSFVRGKLDLHNTFLNSINIFVSVTNFNHLV